MDRIFVRYLLLASLAALPGMIVLMVVVFRPGGDLLEQRGYYLGLDFVNYWTGGRLALSGAVGILYDVQAYNELLRRWFAPAEQFMIFSYPPNALPLLAPLGLLPYLAAYPLWLGLGTAAFFAAALGRWPQRADAWLVVALALSPILWVNLNFGQLGLILALVFVGALRLLPERPVLAGILIGLLTIKPQLGILLPLVLVLTGSWRAFAAAAVTALLLVGLSILLYDVSPWQAWWTETAQAQIAFLSHMNSFFVTQMTSPFIALRFLGASVATALAFQAVVAALVVGATWVVLRSAAAWGDARRLRLGAGSAVYLGLRSRNSALRARMVLEHRRGAHLCSWCSRGRRHLGNPVRIDHQSSIARPSDCTAGRDALLRMALARGAGCPVAGARRRGAVIPCLRWEAEALSQALVVGSLLALALWSMAGIAAFIAVALGCTPKGGDGTLLCA